MLNARILHCHSTVINFTPSIILICPSRIMYSMKIMALKLMQLKEADKQSGWYSGTNRQKVKKEKKKKKEPLSLTISTE